MKRIAPATRILALAAVPLAAILPIAPAGLAAPAAAQDPDSAASGARAGARDEGASAPCPFERCGLRLEGRSVFRGPGDDRVARRGMLYADLRWLETAGDSAAHYARVAARAHQRGELAKSLGAVAMLPFYVSYAYPGADVDLPDDALWTYIGLAAVGLTLTIVGGEWSEPVGGAVSRAIWWYNRDVAAGTVPDRGTDAPPELPPLDPAHFGRAGLVWGAAAGMTAGSLLVLNGCADDAALVELVALPAAGAGLGWLVGKAIPR